MSTPLLVLPFPQGTDALAGALEAANGIVMLGLTTGFVLATMLNNAGGAWDNAKKHIEAGAHGGKGSDAHKAAVVGDTVGDPFKDTSGPSLNILIKLMSVVSLVIAPLLLPLLTGIILIVLRGSATPLRRLVSITASLGLVGIAVALLLQVSDGQVHVYRLGGWSAPFGIVLVADMFAVLVLAVSMITITLAELFAIGQRRSRSGADPTTVGPIMPVPRPDGDRPRPRRPATRIVVPPPGRRRRRTRSEGRRPRCRRCSTVIRRAAETPLRSGAAA